MSCDTNGKELLIGDAVRHVSVSTVMFIYDWCDKFRSAHCNWLEGIEMRRVTFTCDSLVFVARGDAVHKLRAQGVV